MHTLCAVLLLAFVVLACSSPAVNKLWEEWKTKHGKVYNNQVGLEQTFCLCYHIFWQGLNETAWICVSDQDRLQEGSMGEERALGVETQPGSLGGEAQLHAGTEPPG